SSGLSWERASSLLTVPVLRFTSKYRTCRPVATANFGGWSAAVIHVDARGVRRARRLGNGTQSRAESGGTHGTTGHPQCDSTRESRRLQTTRFSKFSMVSRSHQLSQGTPSLPSTKSSSGGGQHCFRRTECRKRRRTLDHNERHDRRREADRGADHKRLVISGDDAPGGRDALATDPATLTRIASPTAIPTCWAVPMRPEAIP